MEENKIEEMLLRRYEESIREYFGYGGDSQGRIIKHYIMGEYEKLLKEEAGYTQEKVNEIYDRIYDETYFKGSVPERGTA